MTNEQTALVNHIRSLNEKTLAWVAEGEGRWACTFVEDLEHWAESGVYTVLDFTKYNLATEIYEATKSVYGYKPNWSTLMSCTVEQLESEAAVLRHDAEEFRKMEERNRAYREEELREEELRQEEWLSDRDFSGSRWIDEAESFGYSIGR